MSTGLVVTVDVAMLVAMVVLAVVVFDKNVRDEVVLVVMVVVVVLMIMVLVLLELVDALVVLVEVMSCILPWPVCPCTSL